MRFDPAQHQREYERDFATAHQFLSEMSKVCQEIALRRLGIHLDAVQVIASWNYHNSSGDLDITGKVSAGTGNVHARKQVCQEYVEEMRAERFSSSCLPSIDPPFPFHDDDDGDEPSFLKP